MSLWSAAGERALRAAFDKPVLVGFDFDGTLAPIVRDPNAARMRRLTRSRLARLAGVVPCAVVSGRALADVEPRVDGVPLAAVIGSHGLEPFYRSPRLAKRVMAWDRAVGAELAALPEVRLERKPYGFAVHYRGAEHPERARRAIRRVLSRLTDARVMWGAALADVVPLGAPAKDQGVEHLRRKTRARHVIYVGDDTTDEDVFRAGLDRDWMTIRVGRSAKSHARYFLDDQAEIDRLLTTLHQLARVA